MPRIRTTWNLFVAIFLILNPLFLLAAPSKSQEDLKAYLDQYEKAQPLPKSEQYKAWTAFLNKHLDSQMAEEIQALINELRAQLETDGALETTEPQNDTIVETMPNENPSPVKSQEAPTSFEDVILGMDALPLPAQIARLEAFITQNPASAKRSDAETMLTSLRNRYAREEATQQEDEALVLQKTEELAPLPVDQKLEAWALFLEEHPLFTAKHDVERIVGDLQRDMEKEESDYLAHNGTINSLGLSEQIQSWQAYLKSNPNHHKAPEIERLITELQRLEASEAVATASAKETKTTKTSHVQRASGKPSASSQQTVQRASWKASDRKHNNQAATQKASRKKKQVANKASGSANVVAKKHSQKVGHSVSTKTQPRLQKKTPPRTQTTPQMLAQNTLKTPSDNKVVIDQTYELKSQTEALYRAAVPGLIIPGYGSWYAEAYTIAGFAIGSRVAGIGLMVGSGFSEPMMLYSGIALYAFSYFMDVLLAPQAVTEYNDRQRSKRAVATTVLPFFQSPYAVASHPTLGFNALFHF